MTPRPSYAQIEALVEFLEQNPGVAKGWLRTTSAKAETKRKWSAVATSINALGGAIKDGIGWAKYWAEKKCALKKHCAERNASVRRTGGGPADNLPPLSELDKRMVAVMGGQEFAVGNSEVAVNPFPDSDIIISSIDEFPIDLPASVDQASPHIVVVEASSAPVTEDRERSPIRNAPRQHRARRSTSMDTEMRRLENIEKRRVDAEQVTAEALANVAAHIERMAVAQENMASAISSLATALLEYLRRH